MAKNNSLFKIALFSYFIDPFFYVSSLLAIFFVLFRFFFVGKFFVSGQGSTNLRIFFISFPYISIITVPLLVFRLRSLIFLDSIPFLPHKRFFSLVFSSFFAFCIPVILLFFVPICVSFFGDVDFFQCLSGFLGIFLYGFSAICLSYFFMETFHSFSGLSLFLSSFFLAIFDFVHLLPRYLHFGRVVKDLSQFFSFAWHFDSFGKGILDSRNIFYYVFFSLALIFLSSFFEFRRIGKKISRLTVFLFALIFLFLSMSAKNLYFRLDLTESRQFSVSETSKSLLETLEGELRITYFNSAELKNLYAQAGDVAEFLSDFARESKNITLSIEKADAEKLKSFGIRGQQIQSDDGTKTEIVTVFSAVLLQYLEKSEIIPFVLSTETLEYDLVQRIQAMVSEKERKVYLLCGNGRSIEESYAYVEPILSSKGFALEILNDFNATEVLRNLGFDDEICVFGSKDLNDEQVFCLETALERGAKAFIATSPFHTTIEEEWNVLKSTDALLSYLNSKGFAFENALVEDISCYPLTMESGEMGYSEYVTVNYPLWVELSNQKEAKKGALVFWASPLSLYGDAVPLLYTSDYAWRQEIASDGGNDGSLFLTNPFLLEKTASMSGAKTSQFVVAARNETISLVSDQFFVSSLMTGLSSGANGADFRNYDYVAKELLVLRGEEELARLMQKSAPITSLYKILDDDDFRMMRVKVILICFVCLPFLLIAFGVTFQIKRRGANRENS